jgi:hypothetical protein
MTSLQNSVVNTYNVVTGVNPSTYSWNPQQVSEAQLTIDKLYQENDKLKQDLKHIESLLLPVNIYFYDLNASKK